MNPDDPPAARGAQPDPAPPPRLTPLNILGVDYWHGPTVDGGDLYLTRFGRNLREHLRPANWFAPDWFPTHRERLAGTSTVYKVTPRPVAGRRLQLVVKWCRVGADVPVDTFTLNKFTDAEFNSPYEEFALLMEMRQQPPGRLRTHKPLAIFVPAERLPLWQTGRSRSKIAQKKARHRDVELDINRQYILIYEWIDGLSLPEAADALRWPADRRAALTRDLLAEANDAMSRKGFHVLDMKPEHLIVRPRPDGDLLRNRTGRIAWAMVDFELLLRTPEHEKEVARARRSAYLRRQRDRFVSVGPEAFPPHLRPAAVLGVEYVFGHTESTQGRLWVVGRDAGLFEYFLPERWRRTPRTPLSERSEVYYTRTKDDINVVWKVSRVGEIPDEDEGADPARLRAAGFNSPFEEFAAALELTRRGIPTVYPRAIYMTGLEAGGERPEYVEDPSHFERLAAWRTPDGEPVLRPNHNYVAIWGFWNGLDEMLAEQDRAYCRGINLDQAVAAGFLERADAQARLAETRDRLAAAGYEDLNLNGRHLLCSLTPEGALLRDAVGRADVRLCNFDFVRPVPPPPATRTEA